MAELPGHFQSKRRSLGQLQFKMSDVRSRARLDDMGHVWPGSVLVRPQIALQAQNALLQMHLSGATDV